jgi:hypothetical protein
VPALWGEWLTSLTVNAAIPADLSLPPPLYVRLPIAAALVAWGARTDRAWTVGIAAMLSLPLLWPHGLAVGLAALPFLVAHADRRQREQPMTARRRFIAIGELLCGDRDPAAVSPSPRRFAALAIACLGIALGAAALVASALSIAFVHLTSRVV